ncbi:hypothetical protein [Planococcus sp. MB-3u-03]|uniref:hypothetical protein n=1 Tax=Planococcus sp. MB-3u-03 TaxID=2058136 RepID=UPI001E574E32|nr:hypothetical protein [Planococcus sp. MB-3u-03]
MTAQEIITGMQTIVDQNILKSADRRLRSLKAHASSNALSSNTKFNEQGLPQMREGFLERKEALGCRSGCNGYRNSDFRYSFRFT